MGCFSRILRHDMAVFAVYAVLFALTYKVFLGYMGAFPAEDKSVRLVGELSPFVLLILSVFSRDICQHLCQHLFSGLVPFDPFKPIPPKAMVLLWGLLSAIQCAISLWFLLQNQFLSWGRLAGYQLTLPLALCLLLYCSDWIRVNKLTAPQEHSSESGEASA